ncbi:hypothetical protein [Winogradskyella schleiferi]|uniref:hypothetical protein n=1 Tax=Winogradskyella schleiferi TaxID=2686078 RepID=UPI0015B8115E|nr:hypothetical protein [Winogradskyella schleiferi]
MDSISDFYMNIGNNFMCSSIVYLPNTLVEEFVKLQNEFNDMDLFQYADKVFVLDSEGYNIIPDKQDSMKYVTTKNLLLDDNLFLLLRKREDYLPTTFDYIFEKYCEYLIVYLWLGEWLDKNLKTYIKSVDQDLERSFAFQRRVLSNHRKEIGKHFKEELERLDDKLKERLGINGFQKIELLEDFGVIEKFVVPKHGKQEVKKTKKNKLLELKKFTKGYADKLILDKIFNIR